MPKPKPTKMKELQGTLRADRVPADEPDIEPGKPTKPTFLKGEAGREYNRLCKDLESMQIMSIIDRPAVAALALAWAEMVEAEIVLQSESKVIESKTGHPMPNPWISIRNQACERMRKLLIEYGLTPASRTKVSVIGGKKTEADDSNPLGL